MTKLKVTREQVLDTSKGFCVACGSMFRGLQSEHVTTDKHIASVNTFDDHQVAYQQKHGAIC